MVPVIVRVYLVFRAMGAAPAAFSGLRPILAEWGYWQEREVYVRPLTGEWLRIGGPTVHRAIARILVGHTTLVAELQPVEFLYLDGWDSSDGEKPEELRHIRPDLWERYRDVTEEPDQWLFESNPFKRRGYFTPATILEPGPEHTRRTLPTFGGAGDA